MRAQILLLSRASMILLVGISFHLDATAPSAQELDRISVTGRVVDATNGLSVAGAVVYILQETEQGLEGRHAVTDRAGHFGLPDVADAPMEFRVRAAGYTVTRIEIDSRPILQRLRQGGTGRLTETSPDDVLVRASADGRSLGAAFQTSGLTFSIQIRVKRSAIVMGRVLDGDGRQVAHAAIAVTAQSPEARWLLTEVFRPPTAAQRNGAFKVDVPADQIFTLEITAEGCDAWKSESLELPAGDFGSLGDVVLSCGAAK